MQADSNLASRTKSYWLSLSLPHTHTHAQVADCKVAFRSKSYWLSSGAEPRCVSDYPVAFDCSTI